MSRKIARDAAMRMLYAYELTGELNQDMIQETIEPAALDAEDMKYHGITEIGFFGIAFHGKRVACEYQEN